MYVRTYEVQKVKAPIGSVRKRNIIFFGSKFFELYIPFLISIVRVRERKRGSKKERKIFKEGEKKRSARLKIE